MNIMYRGIVDGHYIVQTEHRVFVDYTEITEQYDQRVSNLTVYNDVKHSILNGELP